MKSCLLLLVFNLSWAYCFAQNIIPSPETCVSAKGTYQLRQQIRYRSDFPDTRWTSYLKETLLQEAKCRLLETPKGKADLRFIKDTRLGPEAYTLQIGKEGIRIDAGSEAGIFYAVQTLRQLMETDSPGKISFPYLRIEDRPRYRLRSFLLDSGRQYQRVSTIKKYIDMAATLKMNYFHWHLTEGLGWRIEIKKYPRLTSVGSIAGKGTEQQGYYTQEEIREIVRYAADRYITVIPEIDMPGHAEAALSAYPEMSCFGEVPEIPEQGFTQNIFCAGKSVTLRFLQDILDEVCSLFPSPYIHLGGDEAPKENWNKCPDCQNKIKKEGLKNSHELQQWFSSQMAAYLKQKGRKAIFWDDILDGNDYPLPDNVVVHWWNWRARKEFPYRKAVERGYEIICGTNYYTYLNFPLSPWKGYEANRTFDIRDVYEKNPSMNRDGQQWVAGMSCALWTDYELTEDMLDRRLFPRILAIAEQMWHRGEYRTFEVFYQKVRQKQAWFEKLGFAFGPGLKSEIQHR